MNILEQYGHRPVEGYKSKHGEQTMPLPDWLVGVELEIEKFNPAHEQRFGGITFTQDGSLRSNGQGIGIEAITQPVATKYLPELLTAFYKKFGITADNYTERCSTHVHFNVLPLTYEQVSTVCLLYQTVERLLFRYIGHDREYNIFCVPWYQSSLSYNVVKTIQAKGGDGVFRRWQKYSALNLIPISTQGTMEFRHLFGTCDVALIKEWVGLLSKLFAYALAHPLEKVERDIINMNTVSNYRQWLQDLFQELAGALQSPNFEEELSTGVIDSKLMLTEEVKPTKSSVYDDILRQHEAFAAREQARIREAQQAFQNARVQERAAARPVARPRARDPFATTAFGNAPTATGGAIAAGTRFVAENNWAPFQPVQAPTWNYAAAAPHVPPREPLIFDDEVNDREESF